jgi:hypothetical protein
MKGFWPLVLVIVAALSIFAILPALFAAGP